MKKMLALTLTLTLCFTCAMALAEDNAIQIDPVEGGAVVPFEDYGFSLCLPSDWNVMEVTEEQAAAGVYAVFTNAEQTRSMTLAYNDLGEVVDMAKVEADIAASYENVQKVNINGLDFVSYEISSMDQAGLAFLGGNGNGLYLFVFTPASDAEYAPIALSIAGSLTVLAE